MIIIIAVRYQSKRKKHAALIYSTHTHTYIVVTSAKLLDVEPG